MNLVFLSYMPDVGMPKNPTIFKKNSNATCSAVRRFSHMKREISFVYLVKSTTIKIAL